MPLEVVWRDGVAYLHGTVEGQRIRRSAKTRDPEIAEHVRIETEARLMRAALYGPEAEATFADACVLYLSAGKPTRYVTPLLKRFGKRRLATIKPGDLKAAALALYPGASAATRNRSVLKPARAIINFASEAGLCPPMRVKGYYEPMVERPAADRAWIDRFMAHALNQRLRVLCLFMYVTGARVGECIGLGPEHLDLDNKRAVGPPGKNGDPCIYHLTDQLVHELRQLPPRRIHYGCGPARIFGWAGNQGPMAGWRMTCKRARLKYLSPHEAGRHGFGTEMVVRQRIDVVTAARLGRWRDPTVLLRRYAHAADLPSTVEKVFGAKRTKCGDTKLAQSILKKPKNLAQSEG
jgi:integrase